MGFRCPGCARLAALLPAALVSAALKMPLRSVQRKQQQGPEHAGEGRKAPAPPPQVKRRRAKLKKALLKCTNRTARGIRVAAELNSVPLSTIRRDVRTIGGKSFRRPKGPAHFPEDKPKRLVCAHNILKLANKILSSDEKTFDRTAAGACYRYEYVLRDEGQERRPRTMMKSEGVNVWGAIGPNGFKCFYILPSAAECAKIPRHFKYAVVRPKKDANEKRGRPRKALADTAKGKRARKGMDSELFIDKVLVPLKRKFGKKLKKSKLHFIQDGWSGHTSAETRQWLQKHWKELALFPSWSPRSPDLNVIELVWARLEVMVNEAGPIASTEELKRRLLKAFKEIDTRNIYDQAVPRAKECIRIGGGIVTDDYRLKARRGTK